MARKKFQIEVEIPEGIECTFEHGKIKCKKGELNLERETSLIGTDIKVEKNKVKILCQKANKKNIAMIKTQVSHLNNMFKGIGEKFVYELEICNVHFPMTVKVIGNNLVISNFLGEKENRLAKILENVEVEIEGQKVTVSSSDIEKAGQTATNIEKSSKVSNKDKRIFQDGIFIVSKPGGRI